MKKLITFFRPVIILVFRTYWYIVRPITFGAKVIIVNEGCVLLVKTTYGYKLTLPGGGVKKGETPEACAIREAKEEVGITISNLKSLGSIVSTAEYKIDTVFAFSVEVPDRTVAIDNIEIEAVEWGSLQDLSGLGPVTRDIIKLYSMV